MSERKDLKDEELFKVSGGEGDPYKGYSASDFNNLSINDRVVSHNVLGHMGTYYGTVQGFNVEIEFIDPGIGAPATYFSVYVNFDNFGGQSVSPWSLTKVQ